jgi:glycosyltransferase involved in cell wall biosynthesis
MIRIAVDCKSLETVCGVAVYTRELLRSLIPIDGKNSYQLLLRRKDSFPMQAANLKKYRVSVPGRIAHFIWKHWRILPLDIFLDRPGVYFSPNFTLPYLRRRVKTVITVHDLAFIKMPENMTAASNAFLSYWVGYSIRAADHIISVSQSTKSDIMEMFGIDEKRISVVYSGYHEKYVPLQPGTAQTAALRAKYRLPERYILYHGTLEPRKNLPMLLKGYASAKSRLGGIKLVLSGRKGWLYEGIFDTVKELGLTDDVVFSGYIDDADVPLLYNLCEFFVFVSKYEGFGFPVLEAMACGKAVIVSDVSSLPEVVGDAGCKVPGDDWEELGRVMIKLSEDEAWKKKLEKASLDRAKAFSWENASRETLEVLERTAAGNAYR